MGTAHHDLTVGGAHPTKHCGTHRCHFFGAVIPGNNFSISVHPDSRQDADRIFNALAEGGTVTMPMADQFWGDYFGSVTDRFGINWMVNYNDPTKQHQ